jgi:dolichyl-phosphate beta-glucosyltransferase
MPDPAIPSQIDLSIIIPAYMEATNIADSLATLATWLKDHDYGAVEVLVVAADSPDGTAKIAEDQARLFKQFKVVHAGPRVGKGRDVRLGMYEARGRYKLFMDADLATPLIHLDGVKRLVMDPNADLGIAVRNLWAIHKNPIRKLISGMNTIVAPIMVAPGVKDTQCGFKVFRTDVAEAVFSRMTMLSWSFDAEILHIAHRLGYKIVPIPALDWKDPKIEGSGLVGDSPIKAAVNGFLDLFTIRWNGLTGIYKKPTYQHKQQNFVRS